MPNVFSEPALEELEAAMEDAGGVLQQALEDMGYELQHVEKDQNRRKDVLIDVLITELARELGENGMKRLRQRLNER